jgi:hypothetical protein
MSKRLSLVLSSVVLALALAACTSSTPEPTETAAPTATAEPTAPSAESDDPPLTDADRAYMRWLAGVHGKFEDASRGLIERWQASEEAGEVAPGTIEEMESLADTLQEYVDEVETRQEIPAGVAEVHAALLNEVHHWENAAPLLVEGVTALSDADQETFQETAEEADEEIQAAVEARRELLTAANDLLKALQEGADN